MRFLNRHNIDKPDQEESHGKAAIYVCGPAKNPGAPKYPLSLDQQRVLCRYMARMRRLTVVDEFEDTRPHETMRPGLRKALEAAEQRQLDYLIVASMAALTDTQDVTYEVAWHLGHAGTALLVAQDECELVWVGVQSVRR